MDKYKNKVKETLEDLNYNTTFTINFGDNYFPEKEYKDVIYEEGNYESLVVTLGNGEGDNWWCVLFPPICTLEVEENKDIESTADRIETIDKRVMVRDSDIGKNIKKQIKELEELLEGYRQGEIKERV